MLLLVSKPSGNCFFTFGESNTIGLGSLSVQVILSLTQHDYISQHTTRIYIVY